jgi:hypothetical protein
VNLLYAVEKLLAGELEPGECETETGETITVVESGFSILWSDGVLDVWEKQPEPA